MWCQLRKQAPDLILGDKFVDLLHDPLNWVRGAYPWLEPGPLEKHTGPKQWQADILGLISDDLKAGRTPIRIAVASGHGIGKSALMAWVRGWGMSTYPDTRGIVTAGTFVQLQSKTLPEFSKWHQMQINNHWFDGSAVYRYTLDPKRRESWRFDALAWDKQKPEAFQGLHNEGRRIVLLFDEASSIDDVIWEACEGALTDENTEIIWLVFGNPTRNIGRFRDCFGSQVRRWHTRQIDSRTVPGINTREIQRWAEQYGEDSDFFRVRVRGIFPDTSAQQFYPTSLVENAQSREAYFGPEDPLIMSVDVARGGGCLTVFTFRRGRDARTIPRIRLDIRDSTQIAARIAEIAAGKNLHISRQVPDAIMIEGGGIGGPLCDQCRRLGVDVIEVNTALPAMNSSDYANTRAEMHAKLREWLEGGAIEEDAELRSQLVAQEYGFDSKNRVLLESKEDMAISPDDLDSLAVGFARPVVKSMPGWDYSSRAQLHNWDYDPLAERQ